MKKAKVARDELLTPEMLYSQLEKPRLPADAGAETMTRGNLDEKDFFKSADRRELPASLRDQFLVFQILPMEGGQTIAEASLVEPHFTGSDQQPDMYVNIEMQSFHLGANERVDKDTKATMRLVMNKDRNSRDRFFDNVYWAVSAGLDLYNKIEDRKTKPEELRSDFNKALGSRPIEIPGSLANLSFEVIKHRNPTWWQRVFGFLRSDTGDALVSAIGLPGVTKTAINMMDELFNRFAGDKNTEILFESRPLVLALSQQAKTDYTAGNPRIKVGCLNPGFCVLARGRDYFTIANADAYYYPHYGRLVPASVTPGDLVTGNYDDPFANITYAVFKVQMIPTKLRLDFYETATPLPQV